MAHCKNCGVELEADMDICPLCGQSVAETSWRYTAGSERRFSPKNTVKKMSKEQRNFAWEIISIILLSAVIATLLINFLLNKDITWSGYPVGICLSVFSFVTFFTFRPHHHLTNIFGGFVVSSFFLFLVDVITAEPYWALKLAVPILFVVSVVAALLSGIMRHSKYKGINLIAYTFLAAALICVFIDGIIAYNREEHVHLTWSIIVVMSTSMVAIVLLFTHFRLKKGRDLQKTFHL